MRIKKTIAIIFVCMLCNMVYSQEIVTDSVVVANEDLCNTEEIQAAIDAFLMFAESVKAKDNAAILKAKEAMQSCNLTYFGSLKPKNKEDNESLDGHMVFNVAFADSLLEGKDAYKQANFINRTTIHRGQVQPGQILTKTCFVKANGKSIYTFHSRGRQELAVIAEPGGLVTTRVHATNKAKGINEWHNDTADVTKGRNSRKSAFNLPQTPWSYVTLEITNCTNKDISVVVISN